MDRVVASIVQRQDEALNVHVGSTFVFHPGDDALGKEALFFKPGQKEEATDSRQVELPPSGLPTVAYDQTDQAGEYTMKLAGGATVKFAAQPDAENDESSLDEMSAGQEKELGRVCTVTHWAPGERLENKIEQTRNGTELWSQIAWIVLALAAGEMVLARWFSRVK
jgi:hypothetical protein